MTRTRVLEVATEAFGRLGYQGATLQGIAERAGMTSAGVVRLFGSKEQLLRAVLETWDAQTGRAFLSGDARGAEFLSALPQVLRLHQEHRPMVQLQARLQAEAIDPTHPAHEQVARRYRQVRDVIAAELLTAAGNGALRTHLTDQEARAESAGLIALMDGLQQQWLLDPDVDMVAALSRHVRRLLAASRG